MLPLLVRRRAARSVFTATQAATLALPPCAHVPAPYTGPPKEEVMRLRNAHLSPSFYHLYDKPLMLVEGKGQYVFDERGRRYLVSFQPPSAVGTRRDGAVGALTPHSTPAPPRAPLQPPGSLLRVQDAFAGIVTTHVGHAHPLVVSSICEQVSKLSHTTSCYANPQVALYASELAARLPPSLSHVFFVNSGSEATELAISLARAATGRQDVIALRNGYHGISAVATAVTGCGDWRQPGSAGIGGPVHHAQAPHPYLGRHGSDGAAYAEDVAEVLAASCPSGRVGAFIAESIQGVGGVVPLAPGYLQAVYPMIRAAGGVCIADEVQSGFGRTGAHYWGFQAHGVTPDMVTMAKGMGNGFPLAGVACTEAIARSLTGRWLNTYGGNPVAAAAGRAVLRVVEEEGLQENARVQGARLFEGLRALQARHPVIGSVRGEGLMCGVELVSCHTKRTPALKECMAVMERTRELGVLFGRGGRGNTLRITPPLVVGGKDVDFMLGALDVSLSGL